MRHSIWGMAPLLWVFLLLFSLVEVSPFSSRPIFLQCRELLLDGDFERGPEASAWLRFSSAGRPLIVTEAARTGRWGAQLGTVAPGTDQLGQYVSLPTSPSRLTFRLWWYMRTEEVDHPWDSLNVVFVAELSSAEISLATLTDEAIRHQWQLLQIDLSSLAGEQGWLILRSHNDEMRLTTWFVDDVSLSACDTERWPTFFPWLLSRN